MCFKHPSSKQGKPGSALTISLELNAVSLNLYYEKPILQPWTKERLLEPALNEEDPWTWPLCRHRACLRGFFNMQINVLLFGFLKRSKNWQFVMSIGTINSNKEPLAYFMVQTSKEKAIKSACSKTNSFSSLTWLVSISYLVCKENKMLPVL